VVAVLSASLLQHGGRGFVGPSGLERANMGMVCPYCRVRSATAMVVEAVPSHMTAVLLSLISLFRVSDHQ
jgi:hypothetical protein